MRRLPDLSVNLLLRRLAHLQGKRHILIDGHMRVQGIALENHCNVDYESSEELKSMQLAYGLKEQAYGLQNQAMHKVGLGKEADEQKALRDAEKQKGAKLDENETALVKSIADLTYKMGHETLPQLGDLSIKTNTLTSRGGFASGAVMPDKDAVNRRLVEETRKMNEILGQISKKVDDIGKF